MTLPSDDNEEKLNKWRDKEEEDLTKLLAGKYNLPYLDLSTVTIDLDSLKIIPEKESREANMAVFQSVGKKLQAAIQSPNPDKTKEILKSLEDKGYILTVFMVSKNSLEKAWGRYKEVPKFTEVTIGAIDISGNKLEELMEKTDNITSFKKTIIEIIETKKAHQVSEILEVILAGGIKIGASDVHIEPEEENIRLRFRLDGVLHDIVFFEHKIYQLILSRIKLVSGLKLNIKDRAQDGRFSIHIKDTDIEIRTSTVPGAYGESVVMRILNPDSISVTFEELGIEKRLFEILSKEIKKPNGMILTTGPTGSGKTTTLYAVLKKIKTPEIKIITLEDPIEYHLPGITQTQTDAKKGYDFANGLRAILRQDPDVIMVGEIRDLETAKIAINAALTGHLVLSTLHTNNAAGTIPRLIDLGVNPNTIAPALNASLAQRLVRKLCDSCKMKTVPTKEEMSLILKIIESLPESTEEPNMENIEIYKAGNCDKCSNTGYKGRIGIFEAILVDDDVERLILKNPTESDIREETKKQKIMTMSQDGILKVLNGETSLDELGRVIELEY
ncbi:MAG: GspE/PulE family protein [Parcubacteria group bacterium]|nr:GspE/PulE family protein [Parcubacteria group bacterium]MCR4342788.1 GspE/PulE family protein [Patescibacteria group bacterium]